MNRRVESECMKSKIDMLKAILQAREKNYFLYEGISMFCIERKIHLFVIKCTFQVCFLISENLLSITKTTPTRTRRNFGSNFLKNKDIIYERSSLKKLFAEIFVIFLFFFFKFPRTSYKGSIYIFIFILILFPSTRNIYTTFVINKFF